MKFLRSIGLAALLMVCASSASATCRTLTVDAAMDVFISARSQGEMAVSFEPDYDGTETAATVTLQACSHETANACVDYDYDSDADGLGDTNILTGVTIEKTGVRGIVGINYLRVQIGTAPSGTDSPMFTFCWSQ